MPSRPLLIWLVAPPRRGGCAKQTRQVLQEPGSSPLPPRREGTNLTSYALGWNQPQNKHKQGPAKKKQRGRERAECLGWQEPGSHTRPSRAAASATCEFPVRPKNATAPVWLSAAGSQQPTRHSQSHNKYVQPTLPSGGSLALKRGEGIHHGY